MKNIWMKWLVLVWCNSLAGLGLSLITQPTNAKSLLGIFIGICIFIPIYIGIESYTIHSKNTLLQKCFNLAVLIRIILQLGLVGDMLAGLLALAVIQKFQRFLDVSPLQIDDFSQSLYATILTGSLLTLIIFFLTGILLLFFTLKSQWQKP